jgi:phospho-N-acetylmuramoyl-pentapeptide-transferase
MLLNLFNYLSEFYSGFSVFTYLTLRGIMSMLTALMLTLVMGPMVIKLLSRNNFGQIVRKDGPRDHIKKNGTPTMGGLLIISSILISSLLWSDLDNIYVSMGLVCMFLFSLIGLYDDLKKISRSNNKGMSAKAKFLAQSVAALLLGYFLLSNISDPSIEQSLLIPYIKDTSILLNSFLYIGLIFIVIVGSSNAVNLTDGLDGLATMPVILISAALTIFAYVAGNIVFSSYLEVPYIQGVGEVLVISAAIAGSCLGFLWYNTYPAEVFMGDVGSLGLGAILGYIAIVVRQEIVYMVMAGIFVIEVLSVILQVFSFKLFKKRIFKMAPIHHHFELLGWPEPKVIVRFWIITVILVLIGLASLKIR